MSDQQWPSWARDPDEGSSPAGGPPARPHNEADGLPSATWWDADQGHGFGGDAPYARARPAAGGSTGHARFAQPDKDARPALIYGILALVCCAPIFGPLAIIRGNRARRRMYGGALSGDGVALAGVILGWIAIAQLVVGILWFLVHPVSTTPAHY